MKIKFIGRITDWFVKLSLVKKISLILIVIVIGWFGFSKFNISKTNATRYQTSQVEKGTLVVSVTGSGQVSTANNGTISTLATGVISKLYVKDGDQVKAGDKIAEVDLDLQGQQNAQQALASYQSAANNLDSAKANVYSLQASMFTPWKTFMDIAQNSTYQNNDGSPNETNRSLPEFHIAQDNWLAGEAKYKMQQNVINQAQTSLSAAWSSYQQTSPTIYAPITGTVSGFSLQVGSVIVASTNTSNSAQSATKIASVKTQALPTVSINLTEIDIPKIKLGNKATITFDAFPDKTYTGQVVSIDTAGVVSSGVTSYPTVIRLDTESNAILPDMAASASIITDTKDNVLMAPSASIQKQTDGTTYVRVMKNNQPIQITVVTGLFSDTQTEIISGLSEADTVITSVINTSTQQNSQATSPFGGGFGGGGSGGVRFRGN